MKGQTFTPTKLMYPVFLAILVLLLAAPSALAQRLFNLFWQYHTCIYSLRNT